MIFTLNIHIAVELKPRFLISVRTTFDKICRPHSEVETNIDEIEWTQLKCWGGTYLNSLNSQIVGNTIDYKIQPNFNAGEAHISILLPAR